MSIDSKINEWFTPIAGHVADFVFYSINIAGQDVKLLLIWLAVAAAFFTLYFGFVNVRLFKHAIDIISGKFDKAQDAGAISSFQALMASMSGTIGLGNIAGVAVAVSLGGPGAVFWMVFLGFFSMSTKFAEVTLGVKYRYVYTDADGKSHTTGGPMYYLKEAFGRFGVPYLGRFMGGFFAIICILGSIGGANLFQSNQSFQQLYHVTGGAEGILAGKGWLFGVVLSALVGVVVVGGIKSIANVASKLVPVMAIIYAVAAFYIIGTHAENIIPALQSIFREAFTPEAGFAGLLASVLVGFQRAAFSNEAGLGTAPVVYAAARAHNPIVQGIASMLGPFLDTIVICTITALLILISGVYDPNAKMEGIRLTSRALETGGQWFSYVLLVSVVLFAYSTIITFAYISAKCVAYLSGHNPKVDIAYKVFYCLCAILGSSLSLGSMIDFTDAMFLFMLVPNIFGLYLMAPEVKKDLKAYLASL